MRKVIIRIIIFFEDLLISFIDYIISREKSMKPDNTSEKDHNSGNTKSPNFVRRNYRIDWEARLKNRMLIERLKKGK